MSKMSKIQLNETTNSSCVCTIYTLSMEEGTSNVASITVLSFLLLMCLSIIISLIIKHFNNRCYTTRRDRPFQMT